MPDGRWASGVAHDNVTRDAVARQFVDCPEPQILVYERGGWRGVTDAYALGAHMGRWLEAVHAYPRSPGFRFGMVSVNPATWRSVFGLHSSMGREKLKARAIELAGQALGRNCWDDNEAEAALILQWARHSPEVKAIASRRRRKR